MLLVLAIGLISTAVLDSVAGIAYHDQRPFVTLGVAPLVAHTADNGFPSEHSAAAACIGVAALFIDVPLGVVACVIAAALGIARLYCLLHSPVDVLAGWAIGALPTLVAGLWRGRAKTPVLRPPSRT
jgi:undecaprenyl-diphosphatase